MNKFTEAEINRDRLAALREENEKKYRIEVVKTCGDCIGYRWGELLEDRSDWKPGTCEIEEVADEIPNDGMPDWCPLKTRPVLIMVKNEH